MNKASIQAYIDDALKNDLFEIKYQPQFCWKGKVFKIEGAEALLRPDKNVCHVERLVKVAVESGQIIEMGYWVMKKSVQQLRTWVDEKIITTSFKLAVNVSAHQLEDKHFNSRVAEILEEAEVSPDQLIIELTETSMVNDLNVAKIYQLSKTGVQISIDDFGTGYSSLGRLKMLPINEIKIDKSFVDDITKTQQDLALVTAMYQLGVALDKHIIVEGVETGEQKDILCDIGFKCFQGYYFSEPVYGHEFEDTIKLINSLRCR